MLMIDPVRKGQHKLACRGQGKSGFPMQERRPVILLQPLYMVAQRLLGDKEAAGGAGHMKLPGQLGKIVQADHIHGNSPQFFFVKNPNFLCFTLY